MTDEELRDARAELLLSMVVLALVLCALVGVIGCRIYEIHDSGITERLAIEKGYCKSTWDKWVPCTDLIRPEKPK